MPRRKEKGFNWSVKNLKKKKLGKRETDEKLAGEGKKEDRKGAEQKSVIPFKFDVSYKIKW